MPNVDQHTRILIDDYLVITIESFLIDRKSSGRAKGTVAFYELKLRDFSNWCDHNEIKQISQITADDLRRFQLEIQEKHNPGGQSTYYRALKAFLRWVEFEDIMPATWKNPIKKIKAPVVDLLPLDPAPLGDIKALLSTCRTNSKYDIRDRAIILFLFDTGVRVGELITLNLSDIDLTDSSAKILHPKNHKSRVVFFGNETRRALRAWLKAIPIPTEQQPFFMTRFENRFAYNGIRDMIIKRAEIAGINPMKIHSFRRAFALACKRSGVDILSLQKMLGHSSPVVTQRYVQMDTTDIKTAHNLGSPVNKMLKK